MLRFLYKNILFWNFILAFIFNFCIFYSKTE